MGVPLVVLRARALVAARVVVNLLLHLLVLDGRGLRLLRLQGGRGGGLVLLGRGADRLGTGLPEPVPDGLTSRPIWTPRGRPVPSSHTERGSSEP